MKITMRNSLVATICLMGLLVVGFALVSGEIYNKLSLENRAVTFKELAELEVHHRWHKVRDDTIDMGLSIRQDLQSRKLFQEQDKQKIVNALNEHFHRSYVTLGQLDLKKLRIYDKNMNLRWTSTEGNPRNADECAGFFEMLAKRKGAHRLQTISQLCAFNDELRLVVVVPLGGLRVNGYLSIVVDPVKSLADAEKGLGIPLSINSPNGKNIFRSINWPTEEVIKESLTVSYILHAGNSEPVAEFRFISDVTALRNQLNQTRYMIIMAALFITALAVFIALGLLNRTIIKPLSIITKHLNLIRKDNHHLKEKIIIHGTTELEELACNLNEMSTELHQLYYELEVMVFTDVLTGIPNRALLFDRLNQIVQFAKRDDAQGEFILMMMDLNHFKAVNDNFGHHIGDQLLQSVAQRLNKALRSSDTVARLGGDEFAMLMYSVSDIKVAESVAQKITHLMNQVFIIGDHELDVGMSIGIARYPQDASSSSELMQRADVAMYYAKAHKLPFVFYSEDVKTSRQSLMKLINIEGVLSVIKSGA